MRASRLAWADQPVVPGERSAAVSSQSPRRTPPSDAGFTRLKYPSTVAVHGEPGNGLSSLAAPASEVVRYMMRFQRVTSRPALTCQTAMGVPVRPRPLKATFNTAGHIPSGPGPVTVAAPRRIASMAPAAPAHRSTSAAGMSASSSKARRAPAIATLTAGLLMAHATASRGSAIPRWPAQAWSQATTSRFAAERVTAEVGGCGSPVVAGKMAWVIRRPASRAWASGPQASTQMSLAAVKGKIRR
jgi:hypothetical protein